VLTVAASSEPCLSDNGLELVQREAEKKKKQQKEKKIKKVTLLESNIRYLSYLLS
jgi:hypothetical protein